MARAQDYVLGHREAPPSEVGLLVLREDFGADAPPEEPPVEALDELRQAIIEANLVTSHLDTGRYLLRATDPDAAWTHVGEASRIQALQKARIERALALLGKAPGGEEPPLPPPPPYDSFGGTWGPEHGLAFDLYPNGEDGPHDGYRFTCPAAGTVTRYSFGPGPLGLVCTIDRGPGQVAVLSEAAATELAAALLLPEHLDALLALGTYMHIAVEQFDTPQRTPGGYPVRGIWIGHVHDGFATGRRQTGDDFCRCGRSGIEFPGVDAAHGHVCGTATAHLSPNGDVPGVEVARLLGFRPRVTRVPGPADYAAGRADRGKFR